MNRNLDKHYFTVEHKGNVEYSLGSILINHGVLWRDASNNRNGLDSFQSQWSCRPQIWVCGVLMREDIRHGQVRVYCLHVISEWLDLPSSRDFCWRRQWHPTPVLLPGKSHGRRSLEGCSPWGRWGSDMTERLHFHFHALEKEMPTHSSVLAWRIPGMGEPGGLPSLGSHRVGHDWSDLAAAAAAGISVSWAPNLALSMSKAEGPVDVMLWSSVFCQCPAKQTLTGAPQGQGAGGAGVTDMRHCGLPCSKLCLMCPNLMKTCSLLETYQ